MLSTVEKELEEELESNLELLRLVRLKISALRNDILKAEDDLLHSNMKVFNLKEKLRKFRDMYPSLCKPKV